MLLTSLQADRDGLITFFRLFLALNFKVPMKNKKENHSQGNFMRKTFLLLISACLLVGAIWYFNSTDHISGFVQQYVENGDFTTLKARYTPEQIMEINRKDLLVDNQHSYQDSGLKFHPYVLMEIKYTQPDKKSREGMMLWSLVDGEMVINTDTWEKTHGFEDAINAGATRNDFKLMHTLSKTRGAATFDQLQKELRIEKETLETWIESASSKHLVVQKGHELQLHFQDPKITIQPETKMTDWLVKKPYNHAQRVSGRYTLSQIQKVAKAAYGDDFAVRTSTEVFLPVYSIDVLNPDGSTFTSYWNALTGQRMPLRYNIKGW
jgi:hypothetical protein